MFGAALRGPTVRGGAARGALPERLAGAAHRAVAAHRTGTARGTLPDRLTLAIRGAVSSALSGTTGEIAPGTLCGTTREVAPGALAGTAGPGLAGCLSGRAGGAALACRRPGTVRTGRRGSTLAAGTLPVLHGVGRARWR